MESSCLRKRKREAAAEHELEQSHVVGLQEVSHPEESIDLHHDCPQLPPGWEQCLDLQSGQMYVVNAATQTRVPCNPQYNLLKELAAGQGMKLGFDLEMKLPSSAMNFGGMPGFPYGNKLLRDPAAQPLGSVSLSSSLSPNGGIISSPDMSMATTVCLQCHTFVMVSRESPHCPRCKNLCNVNFLPMCPGNAQA
ncbi:hypothetical protein GOP47_0016349 [Adiantum capillus-veneris]|uniref:WW domain-containing protein n=1 Tax=Adiantum capillus-veneris TaxID=13818 RepID=A0A9D4ZAN5_ADICA|nr:hypothetical protein GOP47_0016349 [Adiantum capillus-veneris]